jgi:hypothetical protein
LKVVATVVILFGFTFLFDLVFIFLNYYTWQRLPLINTWRRIKNAQVGVSHTPWRFRVYNTLDPAAVST